MDKRGVYIPEDKQALWELFKETADQGEQLLSDRIDDLKAKAKEEPPRKISPEEYFNSPEFQRRAKIAKETADRNAYAARMAFKQKQENNPIKPRPRKKRGRKPRT